MYNLRMIPSRYNFNNFGECVQGEGVSFYQFVSFVGLECFLWGFGTALGELPPYFISKAAGFFNLLKLLLTKKTMKQMTFHRTLQLLANSNTFYSKICKNTHSLLFLFLLLYKFLIQIPNPLFDLAGISCGHF